MADSVPPPGAPVAASPSAAPPPANDTDTDTDGGAALAALRAGDFGGARARARSTLAAHPGDAAARAVLARLAPDPVAIALAALAVVALVLLVALTAR